MTMTPMQAANLAWNGPPEDPIELAVPCPVCGREPDWKRIGSYASSRYRLECCDGICGDSQLFPFSGGDLDAQMRAVITWNREASCARDELELDRQLAEAEARHAEEDAWVDAHLPMPA